METPTSAEVQKKQSTQAAKQPDNSKVLLFNHPQNLLVVKPPVRCGWDCLWAGLLFLLLVVFPSALLVMLGHGCFLCGGGSCIFLGAFFFFILACGFLVFASFLQHTFTSQVLHIGLHEYAVWNESFYFKKSIAALHQNNPDPHRALGPTNELFLELIPEVKVGSGANRQTTPAHLLIKHNKEKQCQFGSGLSMLELEWILQEVNTFIGKMDLVQEC